ncbi:WG repeat-containing protein [Psychroserpens mesophilus]|uniref:WG repeat-containing protein n=1 Tax=Psychroserpens mesophilus TaxID=325473 RepID=UPI00059096D0|nr:WG repeat-containing protein [Psychroserpens mesophilus]
MRTTIIVLLILVSSLTFGQGNGLYKFQSENGKYGFMDKNGKIKVKAEYLNVGDFSEGLCYVSKEVIKKGYKWIFIDTLGNKVFDIKDNFPETEFSEGFARISSFEEQWFVNRNGVNKFGKTWKDGHGEFKNGIAYVSDKEFSDFYPIDTKGERIGTKTFSRVEIYNSRKKDSMETKDKPEYKSDSYVPFQENEFWGFKDSLGNVVIKPKFYKVDKFKNGVCGVRVNKRDFEIANDYFLDAIINESGEILNEIEMHCYLGFQGELIEFYGAPHFGGGVHYLNKKGEKIKPTE